jgi:hypothetical protein
VRSIKEDTDRRALSLMPDPTDTAGRHARDAGAIESNRGAGSRALEPQASAPIWIGSFAISQAAMPPAISLTWVKPWRMRRLAAIEER